MYTKVFRTMYEGTLADNWQALVTFQQLLILANDEGVVDMTIAAIHRITSIPIDILEAGIKVLEAPDHGSRTPDMEGKRIARLDEHRDWGWFLVNFSKYRQMTTREEKKEADRIRMQAKREAEKGSENSNVADSREPSQGVAGSREESKVSQGVADVAYTDTDKDLKRKKTCSADAESGARFSEFWDAYPKSAGRKAAVKAWARLRLDRLADVILADVKRRLAAGEWRDERYIPHASTYLNGERWNDGKPKAQTGPAAAAPQIVPEANDVDFLMQGAVL
jgi:hypothetical protein